MASLSHCETKTIATSDDAARAAAETESLPSLNLTVADGASLVMAVIGDDGIQMARAQHGGQGLLRSMSAGPPTGITCAEPPPEMTPMSACEPMIAIDLMVALLS